MTAGFDRREVNSRRARGGRDIGARWRWGGDSRSSVIANVSEDGWVVLSEAEENGEDRAGSSEVEDSTVPKFGTVKFIDARRSQFRAATKPEMER